jgi:hypothetical protein
LVLTLTGGTGNSFDFTYNFTEAGAANLVGFGFDTNPNLSSITNVTGLLQFFSNTIFPGSGNIEACFNGGANCSSASGQGDSFAGGFTLNFSGAAPLTLNDFVDRYASIAALNNQSGEGHPFIPAVPGTSDMVDDAARVQRHRSGNASSARGRAALAVRLSTARLQLWRFGSCRAAFFLKANPHQE